MLRCLVCFNYRLWYVSKPSKMLYWLYLWTLIIKSNRYFYKSTELKHVIRVRFEDSSGVFIKYEQKHGGSQFFGKKRISSAIIRNRKQRKTSWNGYRQTKCLRFRNTLWDNLSGFGFKGPPIVSFQIVCLILNFNSFLYSSEYIVCSFQNGG